MMLPPDCRELETDAELQAVYRLRFDVYIEEMGRVQRYADAEAKRLAEPLDASAIQIGAFRSGAHQSASLLGALRIHFATRLELEDFPEIYRVVTAREAGRFALVTRLVTRPESRGGAESAGLALANAAYQRVLAEGVDCAYIDCDVKLAPLFAWLGFDSVDQIEHPCYGSIEIMRMDLHDTARMAASNSPFLDLREAAADAKVLP